ncbi:uncharacterized protein LOC111371580 [Olea europaea subsp. europaea]|uniref:Uncharacterized protein LOC111371580 n=1 Tax=Olea europaea subsp. europaea TaxID=158383 RepID=A0A8S0Q6D4_OLEEU|nr:uncharacterized protein LOC111371580 [Olea europaea subsp. europaea]
MFSRVDAIISNETNSLALLEDGAVAALLLGFASPSTLLLANSSKLNEVHMPNPFHRPQSGFMIDDTKVEDSQLMVGSANLHLTLVLWLWSWTVMIEWAFNCQVTNLCH